MKKVLGSAAAVLLGCSIVAHYALSTEHDVHGAPPHVPFEVAEGRLASAAETVDFLAVGDTGTGDWRQRRVASAMAREAGEASADLVLLLGDIFYREGVESLDDPQWEEKFEGMYEDALDAIPFRPVAGNHDHLGDLDALVAHSERSASWRMPALYYTFEHAIGDWSVEFFALDTTLIVTSDDARATQLAWLEEELSESSARWKIVYGHHPIRSGGDGVAEILSRELEPILVAHGVDLYLAGHDHYLGLLEAPNAVRQVISGAGAKPEDVRWTEDTVFAFADLGFVRVGVTRDELEIRMVDTDREVVFARRIARAGQ